MSKSRKLPNNDSLSLEQQRNEWMLADNRRLVHALRRGIFTTDEDKHKYETMLNHYNNLQKKLISRGIPDEKIEKYVQGGWNRKRIIKELGALCDICGNSDGNKLHIHHKIYRSNGGSDDITNLQVLCHKCHCKLHRTDLSGDGVI